MAKLHCGPRLRGVRRDQSNQRYAHTFLAKPWFATFSSAPMNLRKCLADGMRLSPIWYLREVVSRQIKSRTDVNRPWELACFEEYNVETLTTQCGCSITTCWSATDHQDLSVLRFAQLRDLWKFGWGLTGGIDVEFEANMRGGEAQRGSSRGRDVQFIGQAFEDPRSFRIPHSC